MASTTHATATVPRTRTATAILWTLQIAAAAAFFASGLPKLGKSPEIIGAFEIIGLGQWFRYVTGLIEVTGAVALLVPRAAFYGALLLAVTMVGAVLTHLLVLPGSPVPALVLFAVMVFIAWSRRKG